MSPSGVQRWSPVWVWGCPRKQTTGCENNAQIIRLLSVLQCTKTLYNISRGGEVLPLPTPADSHTGMERCETLLSSDPFPLAPSFIFPFLSPPPLCPFPVPGISSPNLVRGFGEHCEGPSGSGRIPTDKRFLVHAF